MENKKIEVKESNIDPEILDVMKQQDVMDTIKDEKLLKRAELNLFCEFLGLIKEMNQEFNDFMNLLTICSADKLQNLFKELQNGVQDEQKRANVQKKVRKSHQKSKKV